MAPTIFFLFSAYFFLYYLNKNPQTTIALLFLTHNISGIGGVLERFLVQRGVKKDWPLLLRSNQVITTL